MRRKLYLLSAIAILVCIASFIISLILGIVLTMLYVLLISCVFAFFAANKLIKHTNWWKNQYLATNQFVSNAGYRDNIIRNYDIVNLGSNPAHFAFFYQDVKGQSWATGSQGQDMDFEILKYFHSYIKTGGTVIIPIMPFTSIAPYLKEHREYWGLSYYSKFVKLLDSAQLQNLPINYKILNYYTRYPLFFNRRAVRYLIKDCEPDTRYHIVEQPMMKLDLEQDAEKWIKGWTKEFKLKNLQDVFDESWNKYYDEAIELNKCIVDFCIERNIKPVFVCVPMTKYLSDKFPTHIWDRLVKDFVNACNVHNIPFLDYTNDSRFCDPSLYFNSFFLNMKGRKLFTKQVLKDLGFDNKTKQ